LGINGEGGQKFFFGLVGNLELLEGFAQSSMGLPEERGGRWGLGQKHRHSSQRHLGQRGRKVCERHVQRLENEPDGKNGPLLFTGKFHKTRFPSLHRFVFPHEMKVPPFS